MCLEDLGFTGPQFTCCNKREGDAMIQERLDKCFSTLPWKTLFPMYKVSHLGYWRYNHRPVLLEFFEKAFGKTGGKVRKRLYFEECRVDNQDCKNLISSAWGSRVTGKGVDSVLKKNSFLW